MTTRAPLSPLPATGPDGRQVAIAGLALGFGLGGFFDGILLHQILQWHHLLSGVAPGETAADLRFQVLADGIFHLFTYLVTGAGLWLLWRARASLTGPGASGRLAGSGLLGFGAWHVADAILSHWLLGLHRIRMDTDNPLLWDLLWFVPFGLGTALFGWWLLRRAPPAGSGRPRQARVGAGTLGLVAILSGGIAALPPAGLPDDRALVVFRSGIGLPGVITAAEAAGGTPVWSDASGGVWLIALGPEARPLALYRHGALLVSSGPVAAGCLSWSRLPEPA